MLPYTTHALYLLKVKINLELLFFFSVFFRVSLSRIKNLLHLGALTASELIEMMDSFLFPLSLNLPRRS